MMAGLVVVMILSLFLLHGDIGKSKAKPKFKQLFSKSKTINILSAARLFLFGARDVWFVVALPVYFQSTLGWSNTQVGSFMAIWVIGYGVVQGIAPKITQLKQEHIPDGKTALIWVTFLMLIPAVIAWQLYYPIIGDSELIIVFGLMLFGAVFAINSSVHSFLILAYSRADGVSLDVGFYYMANAMGRLLGTVLSGAIYQWQGLEACLIVSSLFLLLTVIISFALPINK
jgi:predicted MFS family arabinose efflux permease